VRTLGPHHVFDGEATGGGGIGEDLGVRGDDALDQPAGEVVAEAVGQPVHRALSAADRTYVMNSGVIAMSGRSSDLHGTAEFDAAYFGMGPGAGKRASQ